MKKVIILGAGLVGGVMARDLCKEYAVTSADKNMDALVKLKKELGVKIMAADLSNQKQIKSLIVGYDLVIGALPGFLGYKALETVINARKNIVDISFFPEDPLQLNKLAKKKNVLAIVDCGVAPGMSNLILGHHYYSDMKIDSFECLVGGLPVLRTWPYQYKVVFSALDVIEEYTRPARIKENGNEVIKTALSEPEYIEFEKIGTLESFNTDGLRSVLKTIDIPNMKERTLRYPGHIEYMTVLRESGFFNYEPVKVSHHKIRPIDFTAKLLFPLWKLKEGEEDFTVMRITITGKEKNRKVKYVYNLLDHYDKTNHITSMARTTGYTCTSAARLFLNGQIKIKGVCPPEYLGKYPQIYNGILKDMKDRNIEYKCIKQNI